MKLYGFDKLHTLLDEKKYPKVSSDGFEIIKTDFNKAFKEGKISFEDDGIYLEYKGKKWRGYMFMGKQIGENEFRGNYRVKKYNDFPRFHLKRCKTIDDFILGNKLNHFYIWSNAANFDVIDKDTKELHKNITLNLCGYCRQMLVNVEETTLDFYENLKKEGIFEEEKIKVDIFGYTQDWNAISKKVKKSKNYTCEQCGIHLEDRKMQKYLHTHHKDGDKLNNSEDNLQCLCIECHSKQDDHHFKKSDEKLLKEFFIKKQNSFL